MSEINLTTEQRATLDEYIARWKKIGVSTEPIDLEKAKPLINHLYEVCGKTPPKEIWLLPSPRAVAKKLDEVEGDQARDRKMGYVGGGMWAGYYCWCDFASNELGRDEDGKGKAAADVAREVSYWWPFENVAILAERPKTLHWTTRGNEEILHYDGGPCLEWPDGDKVFALNNVEVPEWLASIPAEQIDASRIKEIENVEVRREFLRKVGVERVYQSLGGQTIDEATYSNETGDHPYKLITLKTYGEGQDARPYLWMQNPSLEGIFHMERVPLGTKTVREALLIRNQMTEDQVDDENGEEWFQQGDVLLKPKGAKKLKFFPKILT